MHGESIRSVDVHGPCIQITVGELDSPAIWYTFDFIIAFSLNCELELLIGGEMVVMSNILRKCHIMLSLGSNNCNNRQADDAREGTV